MKKERTIPPCWIRQWYFCPRQWFLLRARSGRVETPESTRGVEFHRSESRKFEAIGRTQKLIKIVIYTGGSLCFIWLLLRLL